MIKAFIFDVDGTLLDSMRIWSNLGEVYLSKIGKRAEKGLEKVLYDLSLDESSAYLKKAYDLSCSVDEIKADMLSIMASYYENEAEAKKGSFEFIDYAKKAGIKMGIATSGDRFLAEKALKRLKMLDYFDVIHSCDELKTDKRCGEIYLKIAKELGFSPNEIAVFEDTLFALRTAKREGFYSVAVYDRFSRETKQKLELCGDMFISDFSDTFLKILIEKGRTK